ncbi:hypothetical protein AHF37_11111 [Paragonimus kellicotti]|nr:hypothetical protein AHF37_11111 [Paragonimus kellicotti]
MTEEIPLTVPQLLDMLRVLSPMSKFEKLRDLLKSGLPPGFPLRLGKFSVMTNLPINYPSIEFIVNFVLV